MKNFIYNIPTKAYFGKKQIENLGPSIKEYSGNKILLVYGGGSIKRNGIYDEVVSELKKAEIKFIEYSGIKPNPRIDNLYEPIKIYKDNNLDFILGVGGGSVIDSCKAIAAGVNYSGDVLDLITNPAKITKAAPIGSIVTMAGTGSEMDMASVITVGDDHRKFLVVHPLLSPKFTILDPTYTYTVPETHSMAGVFDAFNHLMEFYFTKGSETTDVQNCMIEGIMRSITKNALKLLKDPKDYDARANIMWASSTALAGFQFSSGKEHSNWSMHSIGHELSSLYDMTHGVTLALISPAYLEFTLNKAPEYTWMFANFARNVFNVIEKDDSIAAKIGIEKFKEFIYEINMPRNLKEAGVEKDKLEYLAKNATERGQIGTLCTIETDDALKILEMSYE